VTWGILALLALGAARSARAQTEPQESTNAWDAAQAHPAVTICLRASGTFSPVIQEALHRIEAELSASGFLVDQVDPEVPHACTPDDPNIKLRSSSTAVDIAASAGPNDDPVLQTVNTKDAGTTAELIAIRAVEGLRAAMMQALRRSPSGADGAPESVRRFTRQAEGESPPAASTPEPAPPPPQPQPPPPPTGSQSPSLDLLMTVGGTLAWDGASPGMNASLSVAWLLAPIALGLGIDAGIVPGSWNASAGSIELRPFGLTGTVSLRLPCDHGQKWECHLGVAAGLRQFSLSATSAAAGGASAQENHASALVMVDGLLGYFPVPRLGLFLRSQAGLLLDAPEIEIGDERLSWGRPSLAFTFGGAARF